MQEVEGGSSGEWCSHFEAKWVVAPPGDPIVCPHKRRQWEQWHHYWTVGVVEDRWSHLGKERRGQTWEEALDLPQAQLA